MKCCIDLLSVKIVKNKSPKNFTSQRKIEVKKHFSIVIIQNYNRKVFITARRSCSVHNVQNVVLRCCYALCEHKSRTTQPPFKWKIHRENIKRDMRSRCTNQPTAFCTTMSISSLCEKFRIFTPIFSVFFRLSCSSFSFFS